jgi:acetyl-CoA acyltransferase
VIEVFRQMKGLCGDYQLKNRPTIGLTANMGGSDKVRERESAVNK